MVNTLKMSVIYQIMCQIYGKLMRDVLKGAVDDPDSEWDEWLMALTDRLFDYKE